MFTLVSRVKIGPDQQLHHKKLEKVFVSSESAHPSENTFQANSETSGISDLSQQVPEKQQCGPKSTQSHVLEANTRSTQLLISNALLSKIPFSAPDHLFSYAHTHVVKRIFRKNIELVIRQAKIIYVKKTRVLDAPLPLWLLAHRQPKRTCHTQVLWTWAKLVLSRLCFFLWFLLFWGLTLA